MTFSLKQNFVRASAIIIPSILFGSFFLHQEPHAYLILGTVISYFIAFVILHYGKLQNRWGYTLIATLIACYAHAILRTLLELARQGQPISEHFYSLFVASGVLTVVGMGLTLPAWLIFVGLDYFACRMLTRKSN